jgi:hypothetical protein
MNTVVAKKRSPHGAHFAAAATLLTSLALTLHVNGQQLLPGPERNTLAPAPNGLGPKKVAAILFNFADNPANRPTTPDATRRQLFTDATSTNSFLQVVSFGQLSLTGHLHADGDVFGWYTLALRGRPDDKSTPSRVPDINQMAQGDGFNAANYDVILYIHPPSPGDPFAGQAFGARRGGKEVEMSGMNSAVAAHESLHILGLDHANGLRCTENGSPVSISSSCVPVGYADPFDIQGGSGYRHPSVYFKARMGWFTVSNFLTLSRTANRTFTLRINPLEGRSTGLLAVRVPIPRGRIPLTFGWGADPSTVDLFYYLEYRRPAAFDSYAANAPVVNGISIRLGTDIDTNFMTQLIDSHPETPEFEDAPLRAGETFQDVAAGVTIRTVSTSTLDATVEISVGAMASGSDAGNLLWYEHAGWQDGTARWTAGAGGVVGTGWQFFQSVFATSGGVVYGILPNGNLMWYRHDGWQDGGARWVSGTGALVGTGWQGFQSVFATSGGVIYAIRPNGELLWYKHEGWQDGTFRWAAGGNPRIVGHGWQGFQFVTASSDGVIYGINANGEVRWYKHLGWLDGTGAWAAGSANIVRSDLQGLQSAFATSEGVLYAIRPNGDLIWYKHDGRLDGANRWAPGSGGRIGHSWQNFRSVFATSNGVIYGIQP